MRQDFTTLATDWAAANADPVVLPGERVTFTRRFFGALLESLLLLVTLYLGWFIWLSFTARKGQTPVKSLLRVYIHDYRAGEIASAAKVWQREALGKFAVPWILLGIATLMGGAFGPYFPALLVLLEIAHSFSPVIIFFTRDRRALWDFHSGTVVRHHRLGLQQAAATGRSVTMRLEELELLWRRARVSKEEYDQKRREILRSL